MAEMNSNLEQMGPEALGIKEEYLEPESPEIKERYLESHDTGIIKGEYLEPESPEIKDEYLEPEDPEIKEEGEELSMGEESLELKHEVDYFTIVTTDEQYQPGDDDELHLPQDSFVAQHGSQHQRNISCVDSGSSREAELTSNRKYHTKDTHKWTPAQTRALIKFCHKNEEQFTKRKFASKRLFETFIKNVHLEDKVTQSQVSKKWENLKKKYKDLKAPKNGSGTHVNALTWQFYGDMHDVLGARPSLDPPVIVSSMDSGIMMMPEEPPASETESSRGSSLSSPCPSMSSTESPAHSPLVHSASASSGLTPSSPSYNKKRRDHANAVLHLLKEEIEKADQRHEENRQQTDRLLSLFETLVKKIVERQ